MNLQDLKRDGEAPEWMTEEGLRTLLSGYLLDGETPRGAYSRLAYAAAYQTRHGTGAFMFEDRKELDGRFFDALWKGWLCPASPVMSNLGTSRGLPISCNSISIPDSVDGIFSKVHELAILSKNGAGVGAYFGRIRNRGAEIKGNGKSEGVIPWNRIFDTVIASVSQGSTRRGSAASYLPIEHGDIEEFLGMRRPTGDVNRRCLNLNHGITITNAWMESMLGGDKQKRHLWQEVLKTRVETGEPYIMFTDHVNNANPECYKKNSLLVETSNLCCLAGDTMVVTKDGHFPIESLVGKTVMIWDGVQWVQNDTFALRGEDEVFEIELQDGSKVRANGRHRWFAASSYNDIRLSTYREHRTDALKVGQWLEAHSQEVHGTGRLPGAYLKGFMLGDGTSARNTVPLLWLYDQKFVCEDKLVESAKELDVEKVRSDAISDPHFSKAVTLPKYDGVYGSQIRKVMKGLAARKAQLIDWVSTFRRDGLPSSCVSLCREDKLKLLAGILDSDGTCPPKGAIQVASKHKAFIDSLQLLVKSFGVSGNVDQTANGWRLTISRYDSYFLLQELPVQRIKKFDTKPNRKNTGWRRIVSITKLDGKVPVYCPTVPSTGKFALANGLMTGNSEITLYTDPEHSFVCCLSSLNVAKWFEWKDTDLAGLAVKFLDAVLEEYIKKSAAIRGLEAARRSALKGRALGVGVLGWHSLLQQEMIPFDSFKAMQLNAQIFRTIRKGCDEATAELARTLGEPEWCVGSGRRNTHTIAIAPTASNSIIAGGMSPGIEPFSANIQALKTAKGTFIRNNQNLETLLESKGKNTEASWKHIREHSGSVQNLDCLSAAEKEVFLTAKEINQHAIIKQAVQRQTWVDQAQSVNLFFASNAAPKYIHEVHKAAWEGGLKTLYYLRSEGVLRGDLASRSSEECKACEG